jgi:hypothetical protein
VCRANPGNLFSGVEGICRKDLKLWRDFGVSGHSAYVNHPNGLYPSPISPVDITNDSGQYVIPLNSSKKLYLMLVVQEGHIYCVSSDSL